MYNYSNNTLGNFKPSFTGNDTCNNEWGIGSYLNPLKHVTDKGIYTILDLHADQSHLCVFQQKSGRPMKAAIFIEMWRRIAEEVIRKVDKHQYVMFELFNEPVDGGNSIYCNGGYDFTGYNKLL